MQKGNLKRMEDYGMENPPPDLFKAAATNDVDSLKIALEHTGIDTVDPDIQAPALHWAIAHGSEDTANYLMDHDANPLIKDKFGRHAFGVYTDSYGFGGTMFLELKRRVSEYCKDHAGCDL